MGKTFKRHKRMRTIRNKQVQEQQEALAALKREQEKAEALERSIREAEEARRQLELEQTSQALSEQNVDTVNIVSDEVPTSSAPTTRSSKKTRKSSTSTARPVDTEEK